MKKLTQLLTALVFGSLMIFISCGGGGSDDPVIDPVDAIGAALDGINVVPSNVTLGGETQPAFDESVFTFTFDADNNTGTYAVSPLPEQSEAADVWPSSGTYTLNESGIATRNDGVAIQVEGTNLTFTINDPSGRVAAFYGEWKFSF